MIDQTLLTATASTIPTKDEDTELVQQVRKQMPEAARKYQWKKGQSGNMKGRPPGKTLKEFAKAYLMSLPDDEKVEYLACLPPEIVWRMAEGNPQNDVTSNGNDLIPSPILGGTSQNDKK